ncbi:muramoyltetrapeptide carboxypeptidase [Enterobacteriaceae bacterium LUAb1]
MTDTSSLSVIPRTIRLVAPSGFCHDPQAALRGVQRLQNEGHKLESTHIIDRRWLRFAGQDTERLADINQLATVPLPDIALAVRGGYGATRLLPGIDYPALKIALQNKPFILCGHSDFTAIQLSLLKHSQLISFSGPMLVSNFGIEMPSLFTSDHFWQTITQPETLLQWATTAADLHVTGTIWGGNLAIIASLVGTHWLPNISDGILVIEDINEHPFRIERMLLHLYHAGILSRQRAIIAGSFSGTAPSDYDNGYSMNTVWSCITELSGVPVIPGLLFGHCRDTVTLPLGAKGELIVKSDMAALHISGYPCLRQDVFAKQANASYPT